MQHRNANYYMRRQRQQPDGNKYVWLSLKYLLKLILKETQPESAAPSRAANFARGVLARALRALSIKEQMPLQTLSDLPNTHTATIVNRVLHVSRAIHRTWYIAAVVEGQ